MTNSGMKKTPIVVHTGNSEFREILGKFTEKNKELGPSKASQYYKLAFRQTKLFHFKEHSFTKKAYFFRSHPHVQEFMSIISWIYLLISFLEPGHSTDSSVEIDSFAFIFTTICECIILTIFAIDGCFKVFFTIVSTKQTYNSRFLCDSVFLVNTISVLCMIIDTMLFHIIYPSTYFRFSRILRPVKVAMESTEVSRTLRALSKTIPQIVDVWVLIMIITISYGVIGNRILPSNIENLSVRIVTLNI